MKMKSQGMDPELVPKDSEYKHICNGHVNLADIKEKPADLKKRKYY